MENTFLTAVFAFASAVTISAGISLIYLIIVFRERTTSVSQTGIKFSDEVERLLEMEETPCN